jgi:hypothetical protein
VLQGPKPNYNQSINQQINQSTVCSSAERTRNITVSLQPTCTFHPQATMDLNICTSISQFDITTEPFCSHMMTSLDTDRCKNLTTQLHSAVLHPCIRNVIMFPFTVSSISGADADWIYCMSYLVGHPELILGFGTSGPWTGLCVGTRGFRVTPGRVGNFTLNMSAGVVT